MDGIETKMRKILNKITITCKYMCLHICVGNQIFTMGYRKSGQYRFQ